MKSVSANGSTRCSCVTFNYLHVTNYTYILFIVLIFFFNDDVMSWHLYFYVFQEIRYFLCMNTPICNDISQLFVGICILKEERIVNWKIKYFYEHIQCMNALTRSIATRARELIPNSNLKFGSSNILENKACSTSYSNKIKLLYLFY
jgi:c-di-AMP phosphodiesterase-like protein